MTRQLTEEDIVSLRKIYQNIDITQKALADLFHVSQAHVSRVVNGLRRNTKKVSTI